MGSAFGNTLRFTNLDEVLRWALQAAIDHGQASSPRGMPTRELLAHGFTLERPRQRRIMTPERRWSFPLALGEFCWHASGANDLSSIAYYAPRWREFSDDRQRIDGSCYGTRIFGAMDGGPSQWDRLLKLLIQDPASRRAVLDLQSFGPALTNDARDVSCTLGIQFFARGQRLHAAVNMRSNDIIWGLPYDVFLFTMLQELLACTLQLDLGCYFHFVGSLHLYEHHIPLATRILSAPTPQECEMPRMEKPEQLSEFLQCESAIRTGEPYDMSVLCTYWRDLAEVLRAYAARRRPVT
ncbi:MAG TPA: thymidylate synthase [Rhizomicrobium sp.]|nr:thymidylate synthase [Rhizomicrobium sp.]